MDDMIPAPTSPFEAIRHTDEAGDFWTARELMPLLEYSSWQRFEEAIQRAMTDCAKAGRNVGENFNPKAKNAAKSAGRPGKDYRLTRYACRLITMTAQTTGSIAAQARTYFSDRVDDAEQLLDPELAYREWRRRAILSYMAHGYSAEWAERRVDDIAARNALTHEWNVRGIAEKEYPILTDRLHMGAFGLKVADHKALKEFAVTYRGRKPLYKGDLPPAMTATELALNALASTVARELHVSNDSQGFKQISDDVDVAGKIVGDTRRQIEAATGRVVVSSRNLLREPDGGLWELSEETIEPSE
ncbi:MAG TPA: hypothetical protein VF792_11175 [Ktedonobacterales bacterium]